MIATLGIVGEGIVGVGGVCAALLLLSRALRGYVLVAQSALPPGIVFVGSFVVLIAAGSGLLLLPAATPADQPLSTVDAVFTITSAVSQTGLVVRPTGDGFTRFGQIIVLIWIQVGALGVLVFGALFASLLGSSLGLRATQTLAEGTEQGWIGQISLKRLVVFIIVFTHLVELLGAAVLYFGWPETWDGAPADFVDAGDRMYQCVFFSVSAFCNAGFATTSNSLEGLASHWTPHVVIALLIILGSVGFSALYDIGRTVSARFRGVRVQSGSLVRLSLNTKIILTTAVIVYAMGFLSILLGELSQTSQPIERAVLDAHFMSINRTSGFDTIHPESMGLLSQLVLISLMFIGGSPGSVAGGVKLMALAVLAMTVYATIAGRDKITAFNRNIPNAVVGKCATLVVLSLAVIMIVTGVLAATETQSLDALLFESVSAFGTTGLSMGITSDLHIPSRIALIAAMFVGRVGPLALLGALFTAAQIKRPAVAYPTESVLMY
ncbi:MAG: TrkH family potassium uptake protein [Phycisphaerales bacterium JB043]